MKKAVIYGAGNIGRGFIAELVNRSGYEVVFVDVDEALVALLNHRRCYPVTYIVDDMRQDVLITGVRAVNGRDSQAVVEEIADCDLLATAVGAAVLPKIAPIVAEGIRSRMAQLPLQPLNIILCENMMDGGGCFRALVSHALDMPAVLIDAYVGFVPASVGRMVPVMTPALRGENLLRVCVEPYAILSVDREAFRGPIPDIFGMHAHNGFDFYIKRKLYVHNMGHAAAAWLGASKGFEHIYEVMDDPELRQAVRAAMLAASEALSRAYGKPFPPLVAYADDLLARFANRALEDTVSRVGADLDRKLAPGERIVGAINLCVQTGVDAGPLLTALAAALRFVDSRPGRAAEAISAGRPEWVLAEICVFQAEMIDAAMRRM